MVIGRQKIGEEGEEAEKSQEKQFQ